jgi:hypothetical protein
MRSMSGARVAGRPPVAPIASPASSAMNGGNSSTRRATEVAETWPPE